MEVTAALWFARERSQRFGANPGVDVTMKLRPARMVTISSACGAPLAVECRRHTDNIVLVQQIVDAEADFEPRSHVKKYVGSRRAMRLPDTMPQMETVNATNSGARRAYWGPGDRYTFLVTGNDTAGSCFVVECLVPPGGGPPMHIHQNEDEMFYLLEGNLSVIVDSSETSAGPGHFVHVKRGIPHTYRNTGDHVAKMLAVFTPAGMEGWFEEALNPATNDGLGPPASPELIARMLAAGPKYGVVWP